MSKRSLPWLQFYPADWESDSVAGCTLAAQGLWLRMICVMQTSRSYGCLEVEGKPIPDELLFRRCGCVSVEEYRSLLEELFAAGVPGRREDGVIFSRRMVRDQQDRDATAQRVRRYRERASCNASVTPMLQGEVRSQKSETRSQSKRNPAANPPPPADPRHQPFYSAAFESFRAKHGKPPVWGGKDQSGLRRFLKEHPEIALPEWEGRVRNYFDSTEAFTLKQGGSLAYLISRFDSFIEGPIQALPSKNEAGKQEAWVGSLDVGRKPPDYSAECAEILKRHPDLAPGYAKGMGRQQ